MVTKICKKCEKEFKTYPSSNVGGYCSRKCYWESKVKKGRKSCLMCGKIIIRPKYESTKRFEGKKYCSRKCCGESLKNGTRKVCEICDKIFYIANSHKKQRFCSSDCYGKYEGQKFIGEKSKNWKGGVPINLMKHRRRMLERGVIGFFTEQEWENLKKKYDYMCLCCKKIEPEIKLTKDHIIPLIKNGTDYISNIQPLCRSCNSIKHTRTINFAEEFSVKPIVIV